MTLDCKSPKVVCYEGRLTLEKWIVWTQDGGLSLAEIYTESDFKRLFEVIAESDFILDNFFAFPVILQNRLMNYLEDNENFFKDYTAALDLLYRVSTMELSPLLLSSESDIYRSSLRESSEIMKKHLSDRNERYRAEFEGFRDHQALASDHYSAGLIHVIQFTTHALGVVHGCATVREVIGSWIELKDYHNLIEFVALVDNWDKVKEYPIDWAIQLSSASK